MGFIYDLLTLVARFLGFINEFLGGNRLKSPGKRQDLANYND